LYSLFAFNIFDATILSNPAFSYLNIGSHSNVNVSSVPAPNNFVELMLNNKDGGDFEVTGADMEALLDPGSVASESLAKVMASDRVHFPNGIPYSLIQRVVEKCVAQPRIDQFWNQPADETRVHGLLVNFIKSHQRLFIEARNDRETEAAKDGGTLEEYIRISDQLLNAQDDAARAKAAQSLGLEGVVQVVGSHYALQKKSRLAWFVIQIVKKSLSQKKESSNEALLETITRVLDETDIANGRAPEKTTQEFDRIVLTLLGEYAKSSRDPIAVQSLLWVSLRPELDPSLRKQARDLREACGNALLLPPTSIRGHHLSLALKYLSIKTGSRFNSSGISKDSPSDQITDLDSLLKNNPPANPLYTMPLKGVTVAGLGAADTPYASGLFIVLSGIDGSIGTTPYTAQGQTGIRYVLVNDMGYECGERDEQKINIIKEIERLKNAYPRVEFIQANQAVERLNAIVTQHDDAALKDGGGRTGGIDFRALPLVTQPGMSPSMTQPVIDMKALQSLAQQSKMRDLDKEWARIEKQIAGKVMPYEKIKEYLAVCSDRKASGDQLSRVEQCLSNILKLEEACAVSTSAQMKELLLLVETVRT